MHRSGFTLIELLLVMVILVVLAAVVVPKFTSRSEQARKTAAVTDISTMDTQLEAYETDNGKYPSSEEGLAALLVNPGNLPNWHGPYLKKNDIPKDPWGNQYVYRFPGSHNVNSPDLFSTGPDGHEGGGDDIDNWGGSK
jgi:general secretion pathway protein G